MVDFVHLHVHSDYSLQDAAVSVNALVKRAKKLGMKHLALTDHGNMFGAMEFIGACKKNGINPIVGCEAYVSPGSRFEKKGSENENNYYHLILLAKNRTGYFNLVKLCSLAYTDGFYYKPRIDEEILSLYKDGLIALSACASGEIPRLIQAGKTDLAEKKALFYKDLFGKDEQGNPNFYLEIQDHGIPAGGIRGAEISQREICRVLDSISKKTEIPLAATNDVHYLDRDDFIAHDIMLCIGTGKVRTEEKRKRYYGDQFYFKSGDEMTELFGEYPQAIENTTLIADRCKSDVPEIDVTDLPAYLPEYDIPEGFGSPDLYLRHLSVKGLENRYPKEKTASGREWENIIKRAEYELETIIKMNFTGYFLIVWDFIRYAKEIDISVGPGRGSGAGSIIAYALNITNVDPLKYGLIFERFINSERISMPDFDIDFEVERRKEIINYVTNKYGKERVAQIITFATLGAKAVIKDVARVLGISIPESEMITKLITGSTLENSFEVEPKLRGLEKDVRYAELFPLARKLEDLNRHSGIHAAGIVIGKTNLNDMVPLFRDPKTENIATQYRMNYLEGAGLIKMDFLGLETLDLIKHSVKLIRMRGGEYSDFDIENIPENDKKTFKMLGEGKSFGIFQFESDGMQNILKQTKPNSIDDLAALNAMYRPGPMQNIPRFVDSKNGKSAITYPDPSLEDVLKETYGVIVYQEQVMNVARIIAGYSMGQADVLRKAMGKKIKEIIEQEKVPFIESAERNGFSKRKASEIYDIMAPFAGYGFNKSHAVAYAILAYKTTYLKANFPVEFMASILKINSHNTDKLSYCIDEVRKMGIEVQPPSVNHSNKYFSVVGDKIVYGFLGIKGVGEAPSEEIERGRKESPYKSFMDFLDRVDIKRVSKKVIELLIQTGAFDEFDVTRETLLGNMENAIEYSLKKNEDKKTGQTNLFEDIPEAGMREFKFEEFPAESFLEKLNMEKQLLGFYFSGHPMDEYKEIWQRTVNIDLSKTDNLRAGQCVLVGIINGIRSIITKKGSKMAFASLSDYNGQIDLTFFPNTWEKYQDKIEQDKIYILKGTIDYQSDKDKYSFIVDEIVNKENADSVLQPEEVHVRLLPDAVDNDEKLMALRDFLADSQGHCLLFLHIPDLKEEKTIKVYSGIDSSVNVINELKNNICVEEIWRK